MNKTIITTFGVAIGLAFSSGVMAQALSKQEYKDTMERIESDYSSDKKNCQSLSGNANDICIAEADGKEKVAKANLEARDKNTKGAYHDARIAGIEARYSVAKERCDEKTGNNKDVCMKEAKAAEVTAKADAKAQMKSSKAHTMANEKSNEARKDAREKSADARHDAAVDKHDAEFSVAKEKCDVLAGNARTNCINDAKARYGKM